MTCWSWLSTEAGVKHLLRYKRRSLHSVKPEEGRRRGRESMKHRDREREKVYSFFLPGWFSPPQHPPQTASEVSLPRAYHNLLRLATLAVVARGNGADHLSLLCLIS